MTKCCVYIKIREGIKRVKDRLLGESMLPHDINNIILIFHPYLLGGRHKEDSSR